MGSAVDDSNDFVVLVTGFDAFRDEYPVNPSWEIARRLPAYLPGTETTGTAGQTRRRVRIVVYPEPIRVNWQVVRKLVPTLWDGTATATDKTVPARIDLLLHMGMAGPRQRYSLERIGRRDGYALPDVDNQLLGDTAQDRTDPAWPWYGVPAALQSDLDLDDVLQRWRATAPAGSDLRISTDAGRYMCDFVYFSSLAHLYRKKEQTAGGGNDPRYARSRVAFLHVPAAATAERVEAGRVLVVELIRALVGAEEAAALADKSRGAEAAPTAVSEAPAKSTDKWYCDDGE